MTPSPPELQRRLRIPDPASVHRIDSDAEALDTAHRLAAEFAPGAAARDHERLLPWHELDRWSASGLGGITVPRDYGGADVSYATLAEVFVVLCQADPALGQIPQNHFGLLGVLREVGTEAQKRRFYGEVLAGRRLGNAGPERRSEASPTIAQGATRLADTAGGLRLNGRRFYSTGALFAHRIPTRATDPQGRPVQAWVPHDARGLTVIDDWNAFGQRTTASGSVVFDDVQVDPADVLPVWQLADRPGLYGPNSQLVQAAIDLGIAQAAVAEAKVLTTRIALEASEKLFELAGSAATRARHQLDRHWRNARVHTLHDPVRWKVQLIGGYHLNGALPARHSWN